MLRDIEFVLKSVLDAQMINIQQMDNMLIRFNLITKN